MLKPNEVITDPERIQRITDMLCAPKNAYHVQSQLRVDWKFPRWVPAYYYDGKLYLIFPGVLLVYDWFLWCAYMREFHENQKESISVCEPEP